MQTIAELTSGIASNALSFYQAVRARDTFEDHMISMGDITTALETFKGAEGIMVRSTGLSRRLCNIFASDIYEFDVETREAGFYIVFGDGSILNYMPAPKNEISDSVLSLGRPFDFTKEFATLGRTEFVAATPKLLRRIYDLQGEINDQLRCAKPDATSMFEPQSDFDYVFSSMRTAQIGLDYTSEAAAQLIEAGRLCWAALELPPYVDLLLYSAISADQPLRAILEGEVDHSTLDYEDDIAELLALMVAPLTFRGISHEVWKGPSSTVVRGAPHWVPIHEFRYQDESPASNHQRLTARARILEICEARGRADLAARLSSDWTLGIKGDH